MLKLKSVYKLSWFVIFLILVACNSNNVTISEPESLSGDDFIGYWGDAEPLCPTNFVTIEKEASNYIVTLEQFGSGNGEEKFPAVYEDGLLNGVGYPATIMLGSDGKELAVYEMGDEQRYKQLSDEEMVDIFGISRDEVESMIIGTWNKLDRSGVYSGDILILEEDRTYKFGVNDSGTYSIDKSDPDSILITFYPSEWHSSLDGPPSKISVTSCFLILNVTRTAAGGLDGLFVRTS